MGILGIVVLISLLLLSVGSFVIGYLQFKEKGFLFNNAYIYASKKERDTMNKTPHYHQSAIVFTILGFMFLTIFIEVIVHSTFLFSVVVLQMALLIIYAVASSIAISKNEKR